MKATTLNSSLTLDEAIQLIIDCDGESMIWQIDECHDLYNIGFALTEWQIRANNINNN